MQTRTLITALLLSTGMPAMPAVAQDINPLVRERINVASQRSEAWVRVQVGVNLFMPGPSGDGDEADQLRERARRAVYQMAAAECRLLKEVLADTCRLNSININVNRQQRAGQTEGVMANGNFTMQITLK